MSFGIYEKALLANDLESSLTFAHIEGYDFWEIAIDRERSYRLDWSNEQISELQEIIMRTNMPIFNMVLSIHREVPLGSFDPNIRELALEYLFKAIDFALKLGIRTIQIAGYFTSGIGKTDGSIEKYISSLKTGTDYASEKGIILAIENMDYDLISTDQILEVVRSINNPYLRMFLDVGNFVANKLNPVEELSNALDYIVALHMKETKLGEYRRVDFGKGIVPFSEIFSFLHENDYNGYLGVEMWNDNNPDSLDTVSKAIEFLKREKG